MANARKYFRARADRAEIFNFFLVLATFEEFGCCKPHSISYFMTGPKILILCPKFCNLSFNRNKLIRKNGHGEKVSNTD